MPALQSIAERFAAVVDAQPDASAVRGQTSELTYAGLDAASERIAKHLGAAGLPRSALVGVQLARRPEQVAVLLGILKAGLAYVPLDPHAPQDRRESLLNAAGCRLLITLDSDPGPTLARSLPRLDARELLANDAAAAQRLVEVDVPAEDLAYVIYTSGSTGEPKGVLIEQAGVVLLAEASSSFYRSLGVRSQFQFFPLAFDGSVCEMFYPILTGLELVVAHEDLRVLDADELLDSLEQLEVDSLITTPSFLARATPRPRRHPSVITVAGERCPPALARRWATEVTLVNAYGPTEATVAATMGIVPAGADTVDIGLPLSHVELTIIEDGAAQPPGEVGEIHLTGPAVARGYHNRPSETAAAFSFPSPGSGGSRTYRTGDLGRRRPDGRIEFLGRRDDQVQVRGFRVEPSEIEAAIEQLPGVSAAAVVAVGEGADRRLDALVLSQSPDLDLLEIRSRLRSSLPEHLVPSRLHRCEHLPYLPSGKLDRQEAARQCQAAAPPEAPDTVPDGDLIASLWMRALGGITVSETDDFFDLGGQSVLAARVVRDLRKLLGIQLPIETLYKNPVLADFRRAVEDATRFQRTVGSGRPVNQALTDS